MEDNERKLFIPSVVDLFLRTIRSTFSLGALAEVAVGPGHALFKDDARVTRLAQRTLDSNS